MKQSSIGIVERVANAKTEREIVDLVSKAIKFKDISPKTLRRVKRKAGTRLKEVLLAKEKPATPKKNVAKKKEKK